MRTGVNRLFRYVLAHFATLARKGKWAFFWRAWIEAVVIAYLVGYLAQMFFPAGPRADLSGMSVLGLLGFVLIVGPLYETVAYQCLSLEITSAFKVRVPLRIVFSVIPFALLHSFAGVPTVVVAGGVGGFYFAYTYERWRKESLAVAIGMTFLLHSSFNLVGAVGMLLLPR